MRKTFFRDEKELTFRFLWFAHKLSAAIIGDYSLTALSSYINDERYREKEQKHIIEIIAYTVFFVLQKIAEDIKIIDGESDKTFDLHITCLAKLGVAFNYVFGYDSETGIFVNLFNKYRSPEDDNEYKAYLHLKEEKQEDISHEDIIEYLKQVPDIGQDLTWHEEYNVDDYHVFRVSKIYNIPYPNKFIDIWKPHCSNLAMTFYKNAFFDYGLDKIKKELKKMIHQ